MSASKRKQTVLVVGSGGREHALAWKLSLSPRVGRVIVVPGNDGMSPQWERWKMGLSGQADFEALANRAWEEGIDLIVVGPDNPLADGIVDVLEAKGILVFGPSAAAARIEASKAFAKEVMTACGVPTARYFEARSFKAAKEILEKAPWPGTPGTGWVVKADGLALGKGVYVCGTLDEALAALDALKKSKTPGRLVIEERLQGEELSWFALCDGERCALLEPARDHKRLKDGDQGPNTGGMGAFSPVPGVPASFEERVRREVFLPVLQEMRKRGAPFQGVLFAGLMVDFASEKFWVLEFNARFGDPETQVLMARLDDDFYTWCEAVARGDLSKLPPRVPFVSDAAVVVVAAANGYPENPEKGQLISGLTPKSLAKEKPMPSFFCAGVANASEKEKLVSSGGRVFGAMGRAATLEAACEQAYGRLKETRFDGMQYRSDIAKGGRL